ncbi:hypothetical protein D9757_013331 [Collybiopsis confluens]|uniref:Major facilitator superfamily (MFS) profile domain-containing protein n=1 Tax=Collybiopsis confluens TaxID=2823264 RepID=A0A8H5LHL9_9AGAR|nr:hypothetical protein D9757_013331 [Collybiopsis confluens]
MNQSPFLTHPTNEQHQENGMFASASNFEISGGQFVVTRNYQHGRRLDSLVLKVKACMTLFGCFLILFGTWGPSFLIWFNPYDKQISVAQMDWVFVVQAVMQFGLGVVGGKLSDLGHTKIVFIVGSLIYVFSFFMLSFADPRQMYQVMLTQGVGMGIGGGLCYVPALMTPALWFPRHQATIMGLVISAVWLGRATALVIWSYYTYFGWDGVKYDLSIISTISYLFIIRVIAGFVSGVLMLGNALIIIPAGPPKTSNNPKTKYPYTLSIAAAFLGQLGGQWLSLQIPNFVNEAQSLIILSFSSSEPPALVFPSDYMLINYLQAIPLFASGVGSVIPGFFADKYGTMGMNIICQLVAAASAFLLYAGSTSGGIIVFGALYGFFYGSTFALIAPVITTIMTSEADRGYVIGLAMAPLAIVPIITKSPLSDKIVDYVSVLANGGWTSGISKDWGKGVIFTALLLIAGATLQMVARYLCIKETRTTSPAEAPNSQAA